MGQPFSFEPVETVLLQGQVPMNVQTGIHKSARPGRFAGKYFLHLEEVDSTNSFCMKSPELLARAGLVVYADRQTAGRGRMGRKWEQGDEKHQHLFASFVIHPTLAPELVPSITICAGLAVYDVLTAQGLRKCSLKWPNDVLVNGLKVCGILCESVIAQGKSVVVAGVGINISGDTSQFPDEVAGRVTTLEQCHVAISRDSLLGSLCDAFDTCLVTLHEGSSTELFKRWEDVSGSIGREVGFYHHGHWQRGKVFGLDSTGSLLVQLLNGEIVPVVSGEVSFV